MIIRKSLNNNVSIVRDGGIDYLVIGRGIAYGKKLGDEVSVEDIEETYIIGQTDYRLLSQLTATLSIDIIETTQKVINQVKKAQMISLNTNLLLTLSDHISFALERWKKGIQIVSPLETEIRRLYRNEIKLAQTALQLINERHDVQLPKEEESLIAMHFVHAQLDSDSATMENALTVASISNEIIEIIESEAGIKLDKKDQQVNRERFLSHLKYLIMKHLEEKHVDREEQSSMYLFLEKHYPLTKKIVEFIHAFFFMEKGWRMSLEDKTYLMIHINRLIGEKGS